MSFDWNNPWLVGIVGGVVAGIILYYLSGNRKRKKFISIVEASVNNADQLLEKGMEKEAFTIYKKLLKKVSGKSEPVPFGHIKQGEGRCYYNLALVSSKEDNLTMSIHSYKIEYFLSPDNQSHTQRKHNA